MDAYRAWTQVNQDAIFDATILSRVWHRMMTGERALSTKDGVEITHEYEQVRALIDQKAPLIFVTGKAGTGKSTLIKYLRKNTKRKCVVLAPTGVAAMNVQGATIHSFFRFPPRMLTVDDTREVSWKAPYEDLELLISQGAPRREGHNDVLQRLHGDQRPRRHR